MPTWAVNSYGYPNPFQTSARAKGSWEMFESFVQRPGYASVKAHWANHPSRPVQPHAVESWKATFEEFGLLFVLRGADNVVVTPGGQQLLAAAEAGNKREFAWVGLNLILRYPLRGEAGRHSRGDNFDQSDLLLYWFLHAALLELDGFWQQELFRVLAHVFHRSEAQAAIDLARGLRGGRAEIAHHPDPSNGHTGGVYNALTQVLVHGSLNHMLFTSSREDSRYFPEAKENWWSHSDEFRELIKLALGGQIEPLPARCAMQASLMRRMPAAPNFADEVAYFDYVGGSVTALDVTEARAQAATAPAVDYAGEMVFLLTEGQHFTRTDANTISGPVHALCVVAEGQRVLVSDDLDHTYIAEHKQLVGNEVVIRLRRARPITDSYYVARLFRGGADV